jgi:hypothetical protein
MALPPDTSFLALRYRSGTPQAIIYNDLTYSATQTLGNTFGTAETSGNANLEQAINRVVWFQDALIATVGTAIYRSTDYGQTWTSVQTLTDIITNNSSKSGLHPIYIDGVLSLCMFYRSTGINEYRGMISTDGITWETDGPYIAATSGTTPFVGDIVFENNIICKTAVSDTFTVYSPRANVQTYTSVLQDSNGVAGPLAASVWVMAKDRLFFVWNNSTTRISFGEWVAPGRVTAHLTDVLGITVTNPNEPCRYGLIFDGAFDEFLAIVFNNTGWEFARISGLTTGSFSSTNISSSARPTTGNLSSLTPPNDSRIGLIADDERNLGGIPPWRIYYSLDNSVGTGFQVYVWGGFNALPIQFFNASGGDASHALPFNRTMGGNPFIALGQPRIELVEREYVSNTGFSGRDAVRLSFKVISGNLPFPQNNLLVQAFHTAPTTEYPSVPSIDTFPQVPADFLSISPSGSLQGNGKVIQGITADDGSTTYQAVWLVPNYIANGDRYKLTMRTILPIN